MQKTKDPGLEFFKYSEKQLCKSLLNPYLDPLVWNKKVGYLPGSMLKFRQNTLGMLELWEADDDKEKDGKKIKNEKSPSLFDGNAKCNGKTPKVDNKNGNSLKIEPSYLKNGMKSPLNTSSYGRKRKRRMIDGEVVGYAVKTRRDRIERESSKTKMLNFDWSDYLKAINAKCIPNQLFDSIGIRMTSVVDSQNGTENVSFKLHQKLEGVDPNNESLFCVLTIVEICGNRMRLHFDGFPEQYDFWTLADSQLIFPAGWCAKNNRKLHPPKDHTNGNFCWTSYLLKTKSEAADERCFAISSNPHSVSNTFQVGEKLEAFDKRNSGMICVATVKDVIGDHILVHFDSWDASFDMWCHYKSPLMQPVGFCEENEKVLSIPSSYGHDLSSFSWDSYLEMTKSKPVPKSAFLDRNDWWIDLKVGMRCEIVDKRCPQLIRVAHIFAITDEHQVTVCFDDWSEKYNYKIDLGCSWVNILPTGWSLMNGCSLQPPPTYDVSIESSSCPVYGCKGFGHVKGPRYSNHQRTSGCPYADCNLNKDFKSERISIVEENVCTEISSNVCVNSKVPECETETDLPIPIIKELEIQIPYDDSEPMDLSMKEYKPFDHSDLENCLSNSRQHDILDDSSIFEHPPGDFIQTKMNDFPPTLSLQEIKEQDENFDFFADDQRYFHQYNPPKNLIPNPVAIIPTSVLRPYTNRVPYHPSDDYRRIMEWNIMEQILPQLKTVRDIGGAQSSCDLLPMSSKKQPKGKNKKNSNKKCRNGTCLSTTATSDVQKCGNNFEQRKPIAEWSSCEVSELIAGLIGNEQYSKAFIEQEVDGAAFLCLKQMDLMKVIGMKLGSAIKISSSIQYLRQVHSDQSASNKSNELSS